jgi:dyslexia susceptibility 1 candidate gene 1 protein
MFTPRETNLPARQKDDEDESDRLQRKAVIGKKNDNESGASGSGATVVDESNNSLWLKERGDYFLKNKQFDNAVMAYESALKLDPQFTECYLNRSLCYMQSGDLEECINDCTSAIDVLSEELSSPSISSGRRAKLTGQLTKVLARRGFAHFRTKKLREAFLDYQKSLEHMPSELSVYLDFEDVKRAALAAGAITDADIQGDLVRRMSSLVRYSDRSLALKQEGDLQYQAMHFQGAADLYTRAIRDDKNNLHAWSNRAATYLMTCRYRDCIHSATVAIDAVQELIASKPEGRHLSLMLLRNLCRRGAAYWKLGMFDEGLEDYRRAVKIDSSNQGLRQDFESLSEVTKRKTEAIFCCNQADTLVIEDKIQEALVTYRKAQLLFPCGPHALLGKAVCRLLMGEYVDSSQDTDDALFLLKDPLMDSVEKNNVSRLMALAMVIRGLCFRSLASMSDFEACMRDAIAYCSAEQLTTVPLAHYLLTHFRILPSSLPVGSASDREA